MILKSRWLFSTKLNPLRLSALKLDHNSLCDKSISHFSENNKENPNDKSKEKKEENPQTTNFQKIFERNLRVKIILFLFLFFLRSIMNNWKKINNPWLY